MSELPISTDARRLTKKEKNQFSEIGYVKNLPVFTAEAVETLQAKLKEILDLLPPELDVSRLNNWHKANRWVYDLCRTPAILDYVEGLAGPNFFHWGSHFFCKFPHDDSEVPWHQDAQYWPLRPEKTVTVWLAIYDSDERNGAMRVVRGSHKLGTIQHHTVEGERNVIDQLVDQSAIDENKIDVIDLKAGEISLHDDRLIHGSGGNPSSRMRAGLTLRYSPTDVKCDLDEWPTFEVYLVRGEDEHRHSPPGQAPTADGFPVRYFQASSEFS